MLYQFLDSSIFPSHLYHFCLSSSSSGAEFSLGKLAFSEFAVPRIDNFIWRGTRDDSASIKIHKTVYYFNLKLFSQVLSIVKPAKLTLEAALGKLGVLTVRNTARSMQQSVNILARICDNITGTRTQS